MSKLKILSIGWGVQSWTLAAMAALGEVEKPDYILHADTTWEHQHTYEFAEKWTPWLEEHGMKVITCCDERAAKIMLDQSNGQTHVPLHTVELNNPKGRGMLNRSCTQRWKIAPQKRVMGELLEKHGLKKTTKVIKQMIGISTDEWTRMKTSDVKYVDMVFPLVDMRISRQDCIDWLMKNKLDVPKKSSCVFCPYHSLYAWWKLKEAGGKDWEVACKVDKALRDKRLKHGYKSYLNTQCKPLDEMYFGEFTEPTLFDLSQYACDSGHCFL